MPHQTQATIILVVWAVLMALYAVNRYGLRLSFLEAPIVVDLLATVPKAGTFPSRAGTLIVFLTNVTTLGLVLLSWVFPTLGHSFDLTRFPLPLWVQIAGGVLFVGCSFVGLLVLLFNPNYTPVYRDLRGRYVIATQGPYRWVRHPRYAVEAALNIVLFLLTASWISLLGLVAWPALYAQARAEEELLLTLAPEAYTGYRRRTGMFFFRIGGTRNP